MKFELENTLRNATDNELLHDIYQSAKKIGRATITMAEYAKAGKTHPSTIQRRFGSWPNALKLAGLQPSRSKIGISDDELFGNIKEVWTSLGRQPRYSKVKAPTSKFSVGTYENRFGSWLEALRAFIVWVNSCRLERRDSTDTENGTDSGVTERPSTPTRRTRREISERQRFRTLVKDGFRCRACGVSPLTTPGTELHVDHILPWSRGGESIDDNLETKCKRCNLGKGNAFDV